MQIQFHTLNCKAALKDILSGDYSGIIAILTLKTPLIKPGAALNNSSYMSWQPGQGLARD